MIRVDFQITVLSVILPHLSFVVNLFLGKQELQNRQRDNDQEENDDQRGRTSGPEIMKSHLLDPVDDHFRRFERTAIGQNVNRLEHLHRRNERVLLAPGGNSLPVADSLRDRFIPWFSKTFSSWMNKNHLPSFDNISNVYCKYMPSIHYYFCTYIIICQLLF